MASAVRQFHLPSAVSHDSGLVRLARLFGRDGSRAQMEVPPACRNLNVMLLGPRQLCREVVEWFGGCDMGDTGLSTKARFTLVKALQADSGVTARYMVGEDAKADLGSFAKLAHDVPSLLGSLAVSHVASTSSRMAQIDFLHPPVIEGTPPSAAACSMLEVQRPIVCT